MTNSTKQSFKIKGSLFTLPILHFINSDMPSFRKQLVQTLEQSPQFFQNAAIVIDVSELPAGQTNFELATTVSFLRENNMVPVGLRGADENLKNSAMEMGLAFFTNTTPLATDTKPAQKNSEIAESSSSTTESKAKLITQSIRSGQQIYAKGRDLIVTGSISPGAEILADGNIHVYGAIRGRVFAGIMGDISARIFCKSLEAELVSIAGRYLVNENIASIEKEHLVTQVFLENNQLKIEGV